MPFIEDNQYNSLKKQVSDAIDDYNDIIDDLQNRDKTIRKLKVKLIFRTIILGLISLLMAASTAFLYLNSNLTLNGLLSKINLENIF